MGKRREGDDLGGGRGGEGGMRRDEKGEGLEWDSGIVG